MADENTAILRSDGIELLYSCFIKQANYNTATAPNRTKMETLIDIMVIRTFCGVVKLGS